MPEQFGFKEKIFNKASELSSVDKELQKRAEWILQETDIESYLKKGGEYLDVGTGKGHIIQRILEDMDKKNTPIKAYYGIDIADKPLKKVQRREKIRKNEINNKNSMNFAWAMAENLPITDKSLDGISYIFSIHHMNKEKVDAIFKEAKKSIKKRWLYFYC